MLASEVMDDAAGLLNDTALALYSYAIQLPYLKRANRELEQLLISVSAPVQRVKSAVINIDASTTVIVLLTSPALPTDFLLPIRIWDRERSSALENWNLLTEEDFEENINAVVGLTTWAFRNNAIYFAPTSTNREIKLDYERKLAVISNSGSTEDFYLSQNWLSARTAELCARHIGQNSVLADEIASRSLVLAEESLLQCLTQAQQSKTARRKRYSTTR